MLAASYIILNACVVGLRFASVQVCMTQHRLHSSLEALRISHVLSLIPGAVAEVKLTQQQGRIVSYAEC